MTAPETSLNPTHERSERTVVVQGIQTHLFEAGSPTAPPLLYLHGMSLANLWLDYHRALAKHFHIYAADTPGFGLTARPDWMRDMSDYILYLRDLLDVLGLVKPNIVGHSLGGWMAAEVAVWYPGRVAKLVLSNASGIRIKGSPIADLFAMNVQETLAACFDNPQAAMPLMPAEFNIDYLIAQYIERMTLAVLTWNPSYDPKLERRLAYVACPTLVIWGENDRVIPQVYADAWHKMIGGSRLVKLAGTGHMPMLEKHAEWTREIADFLLQGEENANV